jgi:hypothetical protein
MDIPKAWATALHEHGYDGIAYRTRFNTGDTATGVAIFDVCGAHPGRAMKPIRPADDN